MTKEIEKRAKSFKLAKDQVSSIIDLHFWRQELAENKTEYFLYVVS